jgi:hypothetical protein
MHPSLIDAIIKERQADLARAARRNQRSSEAISQRRRQRPLSGFRQMGLLLIRLGERLAGPAAPRVAPSRELAQLPSNSIRTD